MISFISMFIVSLLAPEAMTAISGDLNCTQYNGTSFVYTPAAVACSNLISDASCAVLYEAPDTDYPAANNDAERALACYTTASATPAAIIADMKTAALNSCPRTCGLCCQTDAYSCRNAVYPRLNCATITLSQCNSVAWRTIIAQDCPASCGFCLTGGCVDAVTNCGNDLSICTTVGMQDFVNTYCQKTCGRCPSSTTSASSATSSSTSTCTSYAADSSTNCAAWSRNGFCTNTFYTVAQRRARCATTCRLC
uniref:ShKT domain-containing protein n=2 Tax=Caenorhabditis tropicalis TaxID=1561998 RepID=A0A1I7TXN2_9PELO